MQFISFEGGEGSGKTTIIQLIKKRFEEQGEKVMVTREPGGVDLAERIRGLLLDGEDDLDPITEILLFAAARREHWIQKVAPALDAGYVVLCDRFIDSTTVYQGYVGGGSIPHISIINNYATNGEVPDKTIYLDIDPELGLQRIHDANREKNRLDKKELEFHYMVQEGYRKLQEKQPERIVLVNADRTIPEVEIDVWEKLKP